MKYWRKPLDYEKYSTPKGDIYIIDDRCKGCGFCIEFCPNEVLVESEKYNIKGYHPPETEKPESCIGCKLCELICPEFAIYVILPDDEENLKDEKSNQKSTKQEKAEVANNG